MVRAPLLSVQDLRVDFPGPSPQDPVVRAVRGVSFRLHPGAALALVGESGSGKTVTARALFGLVQGARVRGSVRLADRELLGAPEGVLRRVRGGVAGLAFQDGASALDPTAPVGAQVAEAAEVHLGLRGRAAHAEAVAWLGRVGLGDPQRRARQYPHALSGGMRQRALVAAALAGRPQLLVADEPTAHLDPTVAAGIVDLLRALRERQGLALLLLTHDLAAVARLCEEVAVLYAGQVVEHGPTDAVLGSPAHPYTAGLLACLPGPPGAPPPAPIPGSPPDPAAPPPGCAFAPRCPHAMVGCWRAEPPAVALPGGREVRCWLYHPDAPRDLSVAVAAAKVPPAPADPEVSGRPRRGGQTPVLLEAVDLRRHYRLPDGQLLRAVDGVNLRLAEGDAVALVGESGSGKSTLARLLAGLQRPTAGQALLAGRPVYGLPPDVRSRLVQLVFQDAAAALDPRLTVGESVTEGLRLFGAARARAAGRLLEAVGLPPGFARLYPHELSGGQLRRACLARALAVEPRLLLADEPLAGLDPSVQALVLRLLRDLRQTRGLGWLVVAHDLAAVPHLAEQVVVLYLGRVVESGPVAEVLTRPLHPYTRALVAARPPGPLGAVGIPPVPPPADEMQPARGAVGCSFAPRCPHARDRCVAEVPRLREVAPQRQVACHFAETLPEGTAAPAVGSS
jgi:peptide/nickel transport system ATP-binding protein